MRQPNRAGGWLAVVVTLAGGCVVPVETAESPAEISLSIVSGSGQTGAVGAELPQPLVVQVTKITRGTTIGVPFQLVNFRVVSGGGSVFAGSALTDPHGMAREYWTLGPEVGPNVLEVRSVDPSTGEKQVYARFEAIGVIPGPEVCNGFDDNLDGTVDDPTWRYCSGGVPASNTDGMNACNAGSLDLNGTAVDGCERRITGTWLLTPTLTLHCPGLPIGQNFTVSSFTLSATSTTELRIGASVSSLFGSIDLSDGLPIPLIPATESFSGSAPFSFDNFSGTTGSGTFGVDGRFTGPSTFEATVDLHLDLIVNLPVFGLTPGECVDLHQTVTGTRLGS